MNFEITLILALLSTIGALLAAHWLPLWLLNGRSALAGYIVGVACVGIPLSLFQLMHGAMWWHYWLFFAVGGITTATAYGIDDWITKTGTVGRQRAMLHVMLDHEEPPTHDQAEPAS